MVYTSRGETIRYIVRETAKIIWGVLKKIYILFPKKMIAFCGIRAFVEFS